MSTVTRAAIRFLLIGIALAVVTTLQWSTPLLPIVNAQDDGTDPNDEAAT